MGPHKCTGGGLFNRSSTYYEFLLLSVEEKKLTHFCQTGVRAPLPLERREGVY